MSLPVNQIIYGDCLELIQEIPDNTINLVITSPPYFQQRDYGAGIGNEASLEAYLTHLVNIMRECVRVIKPNGSILFNLGDKYQESSLLLVPYRFALEACEIPNVKLVNAITWVKLNPTPRQFKRRLVSSTEPFFHFVKSADYFYNLDAFLSQQKVTKSTNGMTSNIGKSYFELINKSDLSPQQKQHAKEALQAVIQEVKSGQIEGFRMKIRGLHSEPFGGQAGGRQIQLDKNGFTIIRIHGNPLKKDAIEMAVESVKGGKHPAIYPVKLVTEFLHLLTEEDDIVLDPFIGSGSTAIACKLNHRQYIGFELNPDYCQLAEERLAQVQPYPQKLF